MSILAWSWFIDPLLLEDQRQWFFRAFGSLREPESVGVGGECVVIIVSLLLVRCAALGVAPHTIFQAGIPDEASTGFTHCGILADSRRIDCPRESCSLLRDGVYSSALRPSAAVCENPRYASVRARTSNPVILSGAPRSRRLYRKDWRVVEGPRHSPSIAMVTQGVLALLVGRTCLSLEEENTDDIFERIPYIGFVHETPSGPSTTRPSLSNPKHSRGASLRMTVVEVVALGFATH
jgi:hypothetical protein